MSLAANNKLYGTALALLVVDAIRTLPAPVTNDKITDHLVQSCAPKMNYTRRRLLFERVQRLTAKLARDHMLDREVHEGTRRFKYNSYTIAPQEHVQRT